MNSKKVNILLAVINLAAYLGVVIVNTLANTLPINGKNTGELSDAYPNLFTPAGLTFSIWGVIYLVYISVKDTERGRSVMGKIGVLFLISCAANIAWIFAWHYQMVALSLVIMLVLLLTLIFLYLRLKAGNSDAGGREKYLLHLPVSVYLGWITIATIANVTALLVDLGWNGFGLDAQVWTVLVIAVGLAVTLGFLLWRNDIYYALVVDWAVVGILIKRLADNSMPDWFVMIAAIVTVAVVSTGIIIQLIRKKVY